jgi:hypothetical protein
MYIVEFINESNDLHQASFLLPFCPCDPSQ